MTMAQSVTRRRHVTESLFLATDLSTRRAKMSQKSISLYLVAESNKTLLGVISSEKAFFISSYLELTVVCLSSYAMLLYRRYIQRESAFLC